MSKKYDVFADPEKKVKIPGQKLTDITCKTKGCRKKINEISLRNEDPFCSTTCARKFYKNPLPPYKKKPKSE